MRQFRRAFIALVAAATTVVAIAPAASADRSSHDDTPTPPPWLEIENGVSQPQFSRDNAIEETVFVQTRVDSDGDGKRDRVRLKLSRPGETESDGIEVPVIFEHSPYRYDYNGAPNHDVDVDELPQESIRPGRSGTADTKTMSARSGQPRPVPDLPGWLDDYWVPRGYAVVLGESIGTGFSDGCPTIGDRRETQGTKAIIDWLNGRAKAWTADGDPVVADWTTGDVGMMGVSYNGTLPNMVATTGVDGLRTIVPIAAISNWYDYYRANGLVRAPHSSESGVGENAYQGEDTDVLAIFTQGQKRAEKCAHVIEELRREQDRETGDYNAFWRQRNYQPRAHRVDASVFLVHGLEDYNVMTNAFAPWWKRLAANDVPRKIWLHSGGHRWPPDFDTFRHTLNRWMDHWLFGVDNGIMDEPTAKVQRPDGTYDQYDSWPAPGATHARLHLGASTATDPGSLGTRWDVDAPEQSFVDRGRELDTDTELLPDPDTAHPNRLAYVSQPLANDVHVSGTPRVSLRASVDNRYAANLTAVLVDYGPAGSDREPVMVTRGWMDPQNRFADHVSVPIHQGRDYTFRWEMQADDYVFGAGSRIGLVVVSTDQRYTLRPKPGTELSVTPRWSSVSLPVVGGASALRFDAQG